MILVPTLNRIELLKRFVQSLKDTGATCPGLLIVDEKDWAAHNAEYTAIEESLRLLPSWKFKLTKAVSMGDKVREVWDEVKTEKWVGILNDDHVCITPGWDRKVELLLDGTNMVSTDDGGWNFGFRVCGLTAWSMPLLEVCGFPIFPRNLQHLYIDDVWKNIGDQTGCWLETNKVKIEHNHVYNGKMGKDATFEKVNAPSSWEYDAKEFKHFMEQDFKGLCERVVKFRSREIAKEKFV